MASWRESIGRMAQNAVAKSKEMAEITRLNIEISNLEQRVKENYIQLGEYILSHPELVAAEEETVAQIRQAVGELREKIALAQQTILDIRSINICPSCGAEVNRASKFCDKCGAAVDCSVPEPQESGKLCPNCGAGVDDDALFCGSCGARLGE